MILKDEKVLVKNSKLCNSLLSKAMGLRFRKKAADTAVIFTFDTPQTVLMDMWFVFYPIDVVFLDKERRVVEIKENFLPFSFYKSKKDAVYIIEFGYGLVKKNKLRINDLLDF